MQIEKSKYPSGWIANTRNALNLFLCLLLLLPTAGESIDYGVNYNWHAYAAPICPQNEL